MNDGGDRPPEVRGGRQRGDLHLSRRAGIRLCAHGQTVVLREGRDCSGADLVIMHHAHVVQGMSVFDSRSVCYLLGNFCFGGNCRVRAMESLVVVAELTFSDDGAYLG